MELCNSKANETQKTKRLKTEREGSDSERGLVGSSSNGCGSVASPFDFDKHRASFVFKWGEIWAVRDQYGMPRRYALVEKGGDILSVKVKYLKTYSDGLDVPIACGIFSCDNQEFLDTPSFSHKVAKWEKNDYGYSIFPKKGEVWAIRAYDGTTLFGYGAPTLRKYQMLEVLENYDERTGIRFVFLVSVTGQNGNCFQRHGSEFQIRREALEPFSHQVPYIRIPGEMSEDDLLELDPSSLPFYVDDFERSKPKINDNYLFLGVLDRLACECDRFERGYIWVAYDHECRVPQKYVEVRYEGSDQNSKLVMHELVPIPIYNNEKKWHEAGFATVCGKFFIAPEETDKRFILSHSFILFTMKHNTIGGVSFIDIYPHVHEVWGIYKDHNLVAACNPRGALDYQIVAIIERTEKDVKVAYLRRVEGFKGLFKIRSDLGSEGEFMIPVNEFYRFSHKIPSYRFDENCRKKFLRGAFVLDPFMVPQKSADCFSFSDPFLLERSKVRPSWSAIEYFINKQRNPISVASQENNHKESENCIINKPMEQEETVDENSQKKEPTSGDISPAGVHASERMECEAVEKNFKLGEVWAFFNGLNGLPPSYARIDKFLNSGGMLEVTILQPHPVADEEAQWVEANLPMACGTFKASQSTCIEKKVLSHRLICANEQSSKLFFRVYPRKGEVWAIYRNWNINWTISDMSNNIHYKLVEVVSDFTEEAGVIVAALVRAEGHENVFKRQLHEGFWQFMAFKRKELLRFSHRIPSLKITGFMDKGFTSEKSFQVKFNHNGMQADEFYGEQ